MTKEDLIKEITVAFIVREHTNKPNDLIINDLAEKILKAMDESSETKRLREENEDLRDEAQRVATNSAKLHDTLKRIKELRPTGTWREYMGWINSIATEALS